MCLAEQHVQKNALVTTVVDKRESKYGSQY
jgi:hypothetical protein